MRANGNTLWDMHEGEQAVVQALTLEGSIRRRLEDLGLIPGTAVTCCRKAPGGSPIAYRFRGCVIALRARDAKGIEIAP